MKKVGVLKAELDKSILDQLMTVAEMQEFFNYKSRTSVEDLIKRNDMTVQRKGNMRLLYIEEVKSLTGIDDI